MEVQRNQKITKEKINCFKAYILLEKKTGTFFSTFCVNFVSV